MITLHRGGSHYHVQVENNDSEQLKRIVTVVLPEVIEKFAMKNAEYGDMGEGRSLGPRGEFVEINRKVGKIQTAIWDGHPEQLTSEKAEEVVQDIIGHCLMMLDMLDGQGYDNQCPWMFGDENMFPYGDRRCFINADVPHKRHANKHGDIWEWGVEDGDKQY
jgi:hypothetical protein